MKRIISMNDTRGAAKAVRADNGISNNNRRPGGRAMSTLRKKTSNLKRSLTMGSFPQHLAQLRSSTNSGLKSAGNESFAADMAALVAQEEEGPYYHDSRGRDGGGGKDYYDCCMKDMQEDLALMAETSLHKSKPRPLKAKATTSAVKAANYKPTSKKTTTTSTKVTTQQGRKSLLQDQLQSQHSRRSIATETTVDSSSNSYNDSSNHESYSSLVAAEFLVGTSTRSEVEKEQGCEGIEDTALDEELAAEVGKSVAEYLEECLSAEVSVLDRDKFQSVKEYVKSDFRIVNHLGKGSYSDVFEVLLSVPIYGDCDTLHHENRSRCGDDGSVGVERIIEGMGDLGMLSDDGTTTSSTLVMKNSVTGRFDEITPTVTSTIHKNTKSSTTLRRRRPHNNLRSSISGPISAYNNYNLNRSYHSHNLGNKQTRHRTQNLAMKCLRPQIRTDEDQFFIGAEDLVHETAMLASLDHPNIIKLHGRAAGDLTDAFKLNDGYFILLDKLEETLDKKIDRWRGERRKSADMMNMNTPRISHPNSTSNASLMEQIQVANSIADAMSYLHSKNICFRDLKPANVAFDSEGVLKLFDFGFALGLPSPPPPTTNTEPSTSSPYCEGDNLSNSSQQLLFEKAGTPRYMAPEVGLELGYDTAADVYSFAILFWEMCSAEQPYPFEHVEEFEMQVFVKNERPLLHSSWSEDIRGIMTDCWDRDPKKRPSMVEVKRRLENILKKECGGGLNCGVIGVEKRKARPSCARRISSEY